MPETEHEKMDVEEKYKVLRNLHRRYELAKRPERSQILDDAMEVTGLGRKHLITLLNKPGPLRRYRTRQRGSTYKAKVRETIRVVARALDWCCAERLQPVLAETALHLNELGIMSITPDLVTQLQTISISSVGRILKRIRQDEPRLPQRRGRPTQLTHIQREIPVSQIPWDEREPGHFEIDTVHHCGPSAKGDYVCTVQWIDVATGWSERAAIFGRSEKETVSAFERILGRCPIQVRELHPDNGSEFLNAHLMRYFRDKVKGAILTRSRPFHKNDNRFVEQKNSTLVRAYLRHVRLDQRAQADKLNQLYELMGIYYNLFQPVLRQKTKLKMMDATGRIHYYRNHDRAQTPFQRLVATGLADDSEHSKWQSLYDSTNPIALKQQIDVLLHALLASSKY